METGTVSFTLMELFQMGGVMMWPLLFFSIATVFISVERAVYFIYHKLNIDDLAATVSPLLKNRDTAGAEEYLSALTKRRMGARILLALVKYLQSETGKKFSESRAEKAIELEASSCLNSLENNLNFLTVLGSIAPLTGFLGTVTGMIGAFKSIAEATEVNAQIVANGIYEALITTVYGLIIAIIAMIFHSLFTYFIDKFAANIEHESSQLIVEITEQNET